MTPLDRLLDEVDRAASGEFICASAQTEIHVFLQRGRIAWATASTHPFTFVTQLQEAAGIDATTFRDVVETCRRDRLPIGETLVAWGLASWDTVRGCLGHQIGLAISALAATRTANTLFLQRASYRGYDERLTFMVHEFGLEGVHHTVPYFTQAYLDAVAAAAVEMFRGKNVRRIEELLSQQRGEPIKDSFEEIFVSSAKVFHFMATIKEKGAVVVMVTKKTVNQGMGWAALRNNLASVKGTLP